MTPHFSIIVIVTQQNSHLLSFTLESIHSQTFKDFEIVQPPTDENIYTMMNQGIAMAKGEYIHVLTSGEFYISRQVLAFMADFIEKNKHPDLAYTGAMIRYSLALPQIFLKEITTEDLKGGKCPSGLQAYWFRKNSLLTIGNFNPRFKVQGGLDFICRFFTNASLRKCFMRRILTDYEYRRPSPKKIIIQFWETLFIICVHFGLNRALLSWAAKNHLHLLRWWLKNIKGAFWKDSKA